MSDAHHLDPAQARSDFERTIILHRNRQLSWRKIAERENISQRICRDAWARANAFQRGGKPKKGIEREGGDYGSRDLLRGIPLFVPNVRIGGTIRGTDPEAETLRRAERRDAERERRPFKRPAA